MPDQPDRPAPVLLRAAGTAVVLDVGGPGLPAVVHWGADPGPLDADALARLVRDTVPAVPHSAFDAPWPFTLLPGEPDGWSGRPGLSGHRDGADPFPRLVVQASPVPVSAPDGGQQLTVHAADPAAGLATRSELRLEPGGLLRVRHTVTNTAAGSYTVNGVTAVLPVPARAGELLDLTGRWCRERSPQRKPFDHGTHARESRRGRTGHDATLLMVVGTPGFGFRHGEVWGVHVAWSGNHTHVAERLPEGAGAGGAGALGGGELLLPGEVRLAPGESYTMPWVCFGWSADGLDGLTGRWHRWLRARPQHPVRPRPLTLNSWEAVYFDHRLERLSALAERAAEIGAERFVLDDGWFGARRDDRRGLGDWSVSDAVWPQGLGPLADRVRELGMEFGLWVEPEMVNPDSDLVRAHPDWVLGPFDDGSAGDPGDPAAGDPVGNVRRWRHQVVLDVSRPEVSAYLLDRISTLVTEIGISYLKWDHNRDLHESLTPGADGVRRAGVHAQTLAVYRLLDDLRARHPGLEIESCASGGARVDLGILDRTDRIWASDCNDAVERQAIQRWTGLLVPPELVGAHVGPPVAHTTGRSTDLSFRCLTALFGHAGLEWDVTTCTDAEIGRLQGWARLYKELRGLLHSGDVVRADSPSGPAAGSWLHGVVAADRREAVFQLVRLDTSADASAPRLVLPGLDQALEYEVVRRDDAGVGHGAQITPPPWWQLGRTTASGAVLATVGLAAPLLGPEQAVLLHLRAV